MIELKPVVFTKPNTAEFLSCGEVDTDNLKETQVVVKSAFTTVSAGTERANITGSANLGQKCATFPVVLGYNCAGEVVAVGAKVSKVKVGDRVVVYWSKHSNYNIIEESRVVKIEDEGICYEDAAVSFIATFSLAAIRKVKLEIGGILNGNGIGDFRATCR